MIDTAVVSFLCYVNAPVFKLARELAALIYERPDEWTLTKQELNHPKVGTIWIANGASGIRLYHRAGCWKPGWLERRIIRRAVDWRVQNYLRKEIFKAINQGLLR